MQRATQSHRDALRGANDMTVKARAATSHIRDVACAAA